MEKNVKITVPEEYRGAIDDVKALLGNPELTGKVEDIFTCLSAGKKIDKAEISKLITSVEDTISHKTSAQTIARFRSCIFDLTDQITLLGERAA